MPQTASALYHTRVISVPSPQCTRDVSHCRRSSAHVPYFSSFDSAHAPCRSTVDTVYTGYASQYGTAQRGRGVRTLHG
eukprot:3940729-Rhodomonas_salina.2